MKLPFSESVLTSLARVDPYATGLRATQGESHTTDTGKEDHHEHAE